MNPFAFGGIVQGGNYVNQGRLEDQLIDLLSSLKNVTLIAPNGWGKSSLIYQVGISIFQNNYDLRICFIDLQNVFSEETFKKTYLAHLLMISASGLQLQGNEQPLEDILDFPEYIALRDRVKLVLFIANFHMIKYFKDPHQFQMKMKTRILFHKNCAYCFYGNHKQFESHLLTNPNSLLPTLTKLFHLPRISFEQWSAFIQNRFWESGKEINLKAAKKIALKANCIPQYVQLLAWHAWNRASDTCTEKEVYQALDLLKGHYSHHYKTLFNALTKNQMHYLKALVFCNNKICSREVREEFKLGTSGHVSRLRKSLISKEIVYTEYSGTMILDPIFSYWIETVYFSPSSRS
jgi:hypothetical protein